MKPNHKRRLFGTAWQMVVLLILLGAARGVRAADAAQPGRFLLIFENSRVIKKNLSAIQGEINQLYSRNFQNEIQAGDDLAVWTVDEQLHTAAFPLANWVPAEAGEEARQLESFLKQQKFTRHASLAPVRPVLKQVVKSSERLTTIIFCDSQSRLTGTPYDEAVNEIITNTTAKLRDDVVPLILVLRSYRGEYVGCSVNRTSTLSFPKFPPPPEPAPAVTNVTTNVVVSPPPTRTAPVKPLPALIIVGTKASTNVPPPVTVTPSTNAVPAAIVVSNPPPIVAPAATNPPPVSPAPSAATNPAAANLGTPAPRPMIAPAVAAPPVTNPPVTTPVPSAPTKQTAPSTVTAPKVSPPPAEPVATQTLASSAAQPAAETKRIDAGEAATASNRGFLLPLALGAAALVAAIALVSWLIIRSRRPHGSLITRSMLDEPPPPPRK